MSNEKEPSGLKRAKRRATKLIQNGSKLTKLIKRSIEKINKSDNKLAAFVTDLKKMIRLIKAYSNGHYKDVSAYTLVYLVAGIVYFVNPFDVIPDFILGFGFADDATVIAFIVKKIQTELTKFTLWEANNSVEELENL